MAPNLDKIASYGMLLIPLSIGVLYFVYFRVIFKELFQQLISSTRLGNEN